MVRIHPDPPPDRSTGGAIAQLGERLLCKQEVIGSIPIGSTSTSETHEEPPIDFASARDRSVLLRNTKHDRLLFNNLE